MSKVQETKKPEVKKPDFRCVAEYMAGQLQLVRSSKGDLDPLVRELNSQIERYVIHRTEDDGDHPDFVLVLDFNSEDDRGNPIVSGVEDKA